MVEKENLKKYREVIDGAKRRDSKYTGPDATPQESINYWLVRADIRRKEAKTKESRYMEVYQALDHAVDILNKSDSEKITNPQRDKYLQAIENRAKRTEEYMKKTGKLEYLKTLNQIDQKIQKIRNKKDGGLEKTAATTSIIGILGGIFFLSSNITGNVIGLNQSTGNILGVVLLCVGLVGSFFWFKNRKK